MIYKNLIRVGWIISIVSLSVFAGELEEADKAFAAGNSAKAFKIFMSAAKKGNVKAQTRIAYMYMDGGKDFPIDEKKGIEWFQKAADNGEPVAQYIVATMYYDGEDVTQDYSKAINYYQKSAEQGALTSAHDLGMMFETGTGINKNLKISYALFTIASASESSNSVMGSKRVAKLLNNKELAEAKELAKNPKKLWQLINIAKKKNAK